MVRLRLAAAAAGRLYEYPQGGISVSNNPGRLFVVATPIGNLEDISARAVAVLGGVGRIAAEDTRHTAALLSHLGIRRPLLSLHEHNEAVRVERVVAALAAGEDVALVSDAGTPLISDPGYRLVRELRHQGYAVTPVPGACSVIAALSVAGLPSDRFVYEGFLPAKAQQRARRLQALAAEACTVVMLESGHRIAASLEAMAASFGGDREACLARELTKRFETVRLATLDELAAWVAADANQRRGEFVLMVRGVEAQAVADTVTVDALIDELAGEMPPRRAARLLARLTGGSANTFYRRLAREDG
ncbi:Ribosomal RNA small subunit methyltransferase I [wastewater metagenome]|uniref:Ribosomal RNA small subunit methyltransferase I n=2 Tax=unclassified sequences TaxID=12908 RepID=A0A5B8R7A4_9ZZZZ|nr:ribosomal RNA small subunit methyltransferase I [uncultured organism]